MSQEQPKNMRSQPESAIRYREALNVTGELAGQPVGRRDAAIMQSVETNILGQTQKGGTASLMQSAAAQNENAGALSHNQLSNIACGCAAAAMGVSASASINFEGSAGNITIGEALEATAVTSGHRPVDYSDAAAIQAAEVRATGRTNIIPGGVAAAAQSAATRNARAMTDEEKTTLAEVLSDASTKLPMDKPVTRRDAEGVIAAELRNDPNLTTHPDGVAASLAAAARLNQNKRG
ncbi:hypothetical protein NMG60_11029737 [Bertholletia excelsa]